MATLVNEGDYFSDPKSTSMIIATINFIASLLTWLALNSKEEEAMNFFPVFVSTASLLVTMLSCSWEGTEQWTSSTTTWGAGGTPDLTKNFWGAAATAGEDVVRWDPVVIPPGAADSGKDFRARRAFGTDEVVRVAGSAGSAGEGRGRSAKKSTAGLMSLAPPGWTRSGSGSGRNAGGVWPARDFDTGFFRPEGGSDWAGGRGRAVRPGWSGRGIGGGGSSFDPNFFRHHQHSPGSSWAGGGLGEGESDTSGKKSAAAVKGDGGKKGGRAKGSSGSPSAKPGGGGAGKKGAAGKHGEKKGEAGKEGGPQEAHTTAATTTGETASTEKAGATPPGGHQDVGDTGREGGPSETTSTESAPWPPPGSPGVDTGGGGGGEGRPGARAGAHGDAATKATEETTTTPSTEQGLPGETAASPQMDGSGMSPSPHGHGAGTATADTGGSTFPHVSGAGHHTPHTDAGKATPPETGGSGTSSPKGPGTPTSKSGTATPSPTVPGSKTETSPAKPGGAHKGPGFTQTTDTTNVTQKTDPVDDSRYTDTTLATKTAAGKPTTSPSVSPSPAASNMPPSPTEQRRQRPDPSVDLPARWQDGRDRAASPRRPIPHYHDPEKGRCSQCEPIFPIKIALSKPTRLGHVHTKDTKK